MQKKFFPAAVIALGAMAGVTLALSAPANATVFGLSLFNDPNDANVGTVTVTADVNFLNVSWEVLDSTDARLGQNTFGNDQTAVNIGPGAGSFGNPYDLVFQTSADASAFAGGGTSSGQIDGWETQFSIGGVQQLALPAGLQSTTTYDGTTRFTDWIIPLASLNLAAGDVLTLGGAIEFGNLAGNPTFFWPIGLDFNFLSQDDSTFAQITVTAAAVPEPGTLALVALGLAGLGFARRRKSA